MDLLPKTLNFLSFDFFNLYLKLLPWLKKKDLFKEAKEILLEKLLTTPNEQNEKIDYLRELLIREKSNNELIKKLKDEQSIALADKDKEVFLSIGYKIKRCCCLFYLIQFLFLKTLRIF